MMTFPNDGRKHVSVQQMIGKGYADFWNCRKRYRVVKGSRASKKSTTAALNLIARMTGQEDANALVIRKTAATLKDSCFAQLKWAIRRFGIESAWKERVSPMELENIFTGQRIIFRGLDDPFKVTSITVPKGVLCWCWIEEAFELSEEEFNIIDESIRGEMPEGCFPQLTLTFNPWDVSSWLKRRFFDVPSSLTFTQTTDYHCNEWLSDADREKFEDMRVHDPERYKVAGLGEWGLPEGQYFSMWRQELHVVAPFAIPREWVRFRSMDWGSARPYAVHWWAVDYDGNLWCYRELYGWGGKPNVGTGETAREVAERIAAAEPKDEQISYSVLDNACWARTGVSGPSIAEELNLTLCQRKRSMFIKSSKGREDGANALKQRLIGNKKADGSFDPAIRFFSTCIHVIRTLPMLGHDKHNPETYDTAGEDHCTDSVVYACLSRPWAPARPKPQKPRDKWRKEHTPSAWTY